MNYPASTYRIQFNSKFTFKDFAPLLDYLKSLGISTIYASPITKSEKDSVHGYDVTDASMVNPEIGTLEELRLLSKELQQREMTWLQDIVPNHMAFSMDNPKLYDVLERGQFSPFYNYFDIFWDHPELKGKVQIPTLGKELKQCIEEKEISLIFDTQSFQVKYMDNVFPLSVTALPILIEDMKGNSLPEAVIQTTEKLWTTAYHTGLEEWTEQKKQLITTLLKEDIRPVLISFIDKINGDADKLRTILDAQAY
ncbi:MAG TPA: alpha-amylase family glycosyl hydrolase [Cytophagales bacterium]|nr:alpha-amylase family glycosyl hydrolase [Cytophagales bacterium]